MFWRPNVLPRRVVLMTAFAAGLSATMAAAQDNEMGPPPEPDQVSSTPEVVTIRPPYRGPTRSTIGAPIQDVSMSASVTTDDLNLQSPAGWLELQDRIQTTARQLCARMRFQHPIGTPDEFRCRRNAMEGASEQIDDALGVNRGASDTLSP